MNGHRIVPKRELERGWYLKRFDDDEELRARDPMNGEFRCRVLTAQSLQGSSEIATSPFHRVIDHDLVRGGVVLAMVGGPGPFHFPHTDHSIA